MVLELPCLVSRGVSLLQRVGNVLLAGDVLARVTQSRCVHCSLLCGDGISHTTHPITVPSPSNRGGVSAKDGKQKWIAADGSSCLMGSLDGGCGETSLPDTYLIIDVVSGRGVS